jgi:hypothetical protein
MNRSSDQACSRFARMTSGPLLVPIWVSPHCQVEMLVNLYGARLP